MNESGWADTIRKAVASHGATLHELERQSGVATAVLSRFMRGERTLTLPVAEKLCKAIGLRLAAKPVRAKKANVGAASGEAARGKKG